jgi:hypothetical protein
VVSWGKRFWVGLSLVLLLCDASWAQRAKVDRGIVTEPTPKSSPQRGLLDPKSPPQRGLGEKPSQLSPSDPHCQLSTVNCQLNNPLAAPQNIDELLKLRITQDIWMAMYSPLSCLDISPDCIERLQQEAVQNSPVIRELEAKISTINTKIEEAKTNNKKSIDLSVFEPALQVFLKQDTVVENGQSRRIGIVERVGQIFTNPVPLVNDILSAIGIPLLRGAYGGNDAQQSRAIQISDLTVKVAEIERVKTEVGAKTREKVQQLVLDFDVLAREFQAEQAIVNSELKSFKIYSITYAAGDGDTNTYLNRKQQLERSRLKLFKDWARMRAQITLMKNMVMPREQ